MKKECQWKIAYQLSKRAQFISEQVKVKPFLLMNFVDVCCFDDKPGITRAASAPDVAERSDLIAALRKKKWCYPVIGQISHVRSVTTEPLVVAYHYSDCALLYSILSLDVERGFIKVLQTWNNEDLENLKRSINYDNLIELHLKIKK